MLNKNVIIEGERIFLRILTEKDASDKYCSWINDLEVNKYLESKKATVQDLIEYIRVRFDDPNCLFFGIFIKSNNNHIGNIKLEPIDFKKKVATLGILVGEKEYWNKGFGTEALNSLIKFSFDELKLEEINLSVYKQNIGALKAYEKSGFKIYEEDGEAYKLNVLKKDY